MTDQTNQICQDSAVTVFLKKWLPLLLLLTLALFGFSQGWHSYFTLETLVENRARLSGYVTDHFALTLLAYGMLYALAVAISFPGASFLTIVGGLLFGWAVGGLTTVLAATTRCRHRISGSPLCHRIGFARPRGQLYRAICRWLSRGCLQLYAIFAAFAAVSPSGWSISCPPCFRCALRPMRWQHSSASCRVLLPMRWSARGWTGVIAAQLASNPGCLDDPTCTLTLDTGSVITGELIAAFVAMGVVSLMPPVLKAAQKKT